MWRTFRHSYRALFALLVLFAGCLYLFSKDFQLGATLLPKTKVNNKNQQHGGNITASTSNSSGSVAEEAAKFLLCDNLSISSNNVVRRIDLESESRVRLLHIGKAAGGSIRTHYKSIWNLTLPQCHPHPCQYYIDRDDFIEDPKIWGRYRFLLTVRDPIDRFVSAFYWVLRNVFCDADLQKETRTPARMKYGSYEWHHHDKYCMSEEMGIIPGYRERYELYEAFQRNASKLGEWYCSSATSDMTWAEKHWKTTYKEAHLRYSLNQWLGPRWYASKASHRYYPIVLETTGTAASFESQIDSSVKWLYDQMHFEDRSAFKNRQKVAMYRQQCRKEPTSGSSKMRHSSNATTSSILSPKAELCLARYYREDYKTLEGIMKHLCKSDACRDGIQSILDRRRPLLERAFRS